MDKRNIVIHLEYLLTFLDSHRYWGDMAEQCALTGATARKKVFGAYLMGIYAWLCHILLPHTAQATPITNQKIF